MKNITEKQVEQHLRRSVERLGGVAMKFVSPGRDGVTDRIVVMPGGRIWFVELKRPGRTLDPLQVVFKKLVEGLGCQHRTLDSIEAVDGFMTEVVTLNPSAV